MIQNAIEYVKQIFANNCSGHDYHHTMRVQRLAVQIARQENLVNFMESNGVDNEIIETVCKIIEEVSFAGTDLVVPSTIEGKCVQVGCAGSNWNCKKSCYG